MSLPKGVAQTISFAMWDPTTFEYVSGLTLTVTVQKDGAAPVAATNAATEIVTTGRYKLTLTATERNADEVVVAATDGTLTTLVTDYPGQDVLTPLAVVDTVADGIAAKTVNLPASPAAVGSNMGTVASVTGSVASVTGNVGGNVVGSVASVTAKTGFSLAADQSAVTIGTVNTLAAGALTAIAGAVRDLATYGLSALNTLLVTTGIKAATVPAVVVTTNNDKSGYALTTAPPTATANASAVRTELGTELGRVDTAISTRLATAGYTVPPTTAQIEAALLNEGDSSTLLQAIADKVSGDWSAGDVSAAAVASAVRTNLTTELGRIDAAVTTRSTYAGADTSGTTELLTRVPDATAGATGGLAIVGSAMGAVASVTAAVSCADATAAKDDLANATDGLGALKAILDTAGVKVATLPDVQLAATQDHITPISSLSGIATATNVSDAQTAIVAALPDDAPAMITADAIADEVQTRTIARVTLVDTTTTNTDMVAAPDNATLAAIAAKLAAPIATGVSITPATLDTDGAALGRVMPYGRVTVYHGEDAEYVFYADADGDYSYELPEGSVWTLLARHAGYEDTSAEVSTEDSVS